MKIQKRKIWQIGLPAVLAGILSPDALRQQHREMANVIARIDILERQCTSLASMHNGEHKYIAPFNARDIL